MAKNTTPDSLYGNSRDILREAERENEILADIAGEEYESPGDIPKGKYIIEKRLLDAAQKKNELLESIAEGGGTGGGAAKGIGIDYATDVISLKNKSGETIDGSGATLPAYGLNYNSATGGLTLTKNGTAVQGQTVSLPDYGSPLTATSTAGMTDTSKVYVNTTDGKWYYYDGSAWTAGGTYNSQGIDTDTTLLVSGAPADAKATGDAVSDLKTQLSGEQLIKLGRDEILIEASENLLDPRVFLSAEGIGVDNEGYYVGTALSFRDNFGTDAGGVPGLTFDANTQYSFTALVYSGEGTSDSGGLRFRFVYTDDTNTNFTVPINTNTPTIISGTSASGKTISAFAIVYGSGPSITWHIKDIALVKSNSVPAYTPFYIPVDSVARKQLEDMEVFVDTFGKKTDIPFSETHYIGATNGDYKGNGTAPGYYANKNFISVNEMNFKASMTSNAYKYRAFFYTDANESSFIGRTDYIDGNISTALTGIHNGTAYNYVRFNINQKDVTDDFTGTVNAFHLISKSGKSLASKSDLESVEENLLLKTTPCSTVAMYDTWAVIGASRDCGYIYKSPNSSPVTNRDLAWGKILSKKCGNQCANYAYPGASTISWLTQATYGLPALLAANPYNLYVMALGTNDANHPQDNPLGTEANVHDAIGDYTSADLNTTYGAYSYILLNIINHAPDAHIVCIFRYTDEDSTDYLNVWNAIKYITNRYSLPLTNWCYN